MKHNVALRASPDASNKSPRAIHKVGNSSDFPYVERIARVSCHLFGSDLATRSSNYNVSEEKYKLVVQISCCHHAEVNVPGYE